MTSERCWVWLLCCFPVVGAPGCQRPVEQVFQLADATRKLPPRHQRNIADGLRQYFGTPQSPRWLDASEEPPKLTMQPVQDPPTPEKLQLVRGAVVYQARCAGCHGIGGDGSGEAAVFLRPKPRDYRKGIFKFTSTPYGAKPARQDLVRVIRRGAKGTSMPAFPWMSEEDLQAVVDYVVYLSQRGEVEAAVSQTAEFDYDEDEDLDAEEFRTALSDVRSLWAAAEVAVVQPASAEPPYDLVSVRKGRELFVSQSCGKCHGDRAEGQTEWLSPEFLEEQNALPEERRTMINFDAWGEPAPAADLTARMLHGGRRSIDIYRRIQTGINGTPMPEFGGVFAANPGDLWHLVHYIRHIIEGGDPLVP